jgi:hypothetical protein
VWRRLEPCCGEPVGLRYRPSRLQRWGGALVRLPWRSAADATLPGLPLLPLPLPLPVPCSWRHGGDSHHPRHPDRLGAPHHQQREHPA